MKSRGLFPHRSAGAAVRSARSKSMSAGNSSSDNRPTSGDGYKEGSLGDRSSPQAGGQRIADKLSERPAVVEHGLRGAGGCAWDRSMNDAFADEPAPAHAGKMR